jgi:hypothetical protein
MIEIKMHKKQERKHKEKKKIMTNCSMPTLHLVDLSGDFTIKNQSDNLLIKHIQTDEG